MHTVDGDVPLGDASPLSNQDAHVQEQRVHGSDPSVADRISFASAVTGLDRRIDPGVPQGLGVSNGPGERNGAAEPKSLGDGNDPVDYSASPTEEAGGGRPMCSVGAHSFETMYR